MDPVTLYKDYLRDIRLMQLATCNNGQPWLCNVWYVMDEYERVYFMSRPDRRHCKEIETNPFVACTFHKSFEQGLGQPGQALVIAGKARRLPGEETEAPYTLYAEAYPRLKKMQNLQEFQDESGGHVFYEIVPHEIVWWDEVNFPEQSRQKVR